MLSSHRDSLCFSLDEFILDKFDHGEAIWIATLSNGEVIYQDDDRPGLIPSAWLRLKDYIDSNKYSSISPICLRLDKIELQFRGNKIIVFDREKLNIPIHGVWFSKSCVGIWPGNVSYRKYLIGYLEGTSPYLIIEHYTVPVLNLEQIEFRIDYSHEGLILDYEPQRQEQLPV